MIRVRLSNFEATPNDKDFSIVTGESLISSVNRIFKNPAFDKKAINVALNGHVIPQELWTEVKLEASDSVIIAPNLTSGDSGQIIGQLLFIAAVTLTAYYTGPLVTAKILTPLQGALINAGVSLVAGYVASQLVTPPVVGNSGGLADNQKDSQMYAITSQGNAVRKFSAVPKVYGEHKIYPNVAANPYTELEVDPATGKLSQYLYAIYDFGFGPNLIRDIKIGETQIESFNEVQYRLVDPNAPAVPEGVWDEQLYRTFEYYKGDISSESVGVELNGNQSAGDAQSTWEVERNAPANPDDLAQSMTVNFVCPQGLFAFNSSGTKGSRTIDLQISFSKVGEDVWRAYNDPVYVSDYRAIGGDPATQDQSLTLHPAPTDPTVGSVLPYYTLSETPYKVFSMLNGQPRTSRKTLRLGIRYGATFIVVTAASGVVIGDILRFNGQDVGRVASIENYTGPTYHKLNLETPVTNPFFLFDYVITKYEQAVDGFSIGDKVIDIVNPDLTEKILRKALPPGTLRVTSDSREAVYGAVKFNPRQNDSYKIRIRRVSTVSLFTTSVSDTLTVLNINTRTDTEPINTDKRHTFLELRIKATGQLNGSIQNLSAIATSVLDTYDGVSWTKQPTSNPAWIFADLLTGEISRKPVAKSRLDTASLIEWAEYCDEVPTSGALYTYVEKRFECNFILDFETTLQQVLQQVANSAQASLNMIDGKYGVLVDINRVTPVQVFTPRNTSGFSSTRTYTEKPHGLKVSYVDPTSNWQQNVITVYDDGYDEDTAETFQDITTFGVTQVEQAWRFGRYFMAQNKLRQEVITLRVDFENLVCTRGDYVQITQDVMRVGGTAARVKSVSGNRIVIDEGIETGVDPYGFVFRSATGEIRTNTLSVVSSDTFDLDGIYLPARGDLIIIGVVGEIVLDCIVKSIQPQDNMTAIVTLVEKAEGIYDIESIDTIPGYEPKISGTTDPDFGVPAEVPDLVVVENSYNIKISGYEYFIELDWENPLGAATEIFEVYVDFGDGYDIVTSLKSSAYTYIVDEDNLGRVHSFKVLAVSATGKKLGLGEVTAVSATPLEKSTRPSDIEVFNSDITGEVLQLFWDRVLDQDIKEYIIRYSPDVDGRWETSTGLMRVGSATSLIATQARTGAYFIKAADFNDNESAIAATIITTIPNLNGLNIIDSQNDFPTLTGSKDRVEVSGTALVLAQTVIGTPGNEQYYSEGYYYYQDLLDLGDIYTVRLQSLLKAEGFISTDLMVNWDPLSDVDALSQAASSEWDVEAQYRATNSLNVMSDWVTLDSIAFINEGAADNYTAWRKFIVGDATGRIFQFRLKLKSNALAVTPRVLDGEIRADMPDRTDSFNNLSAPDTGYTVTYDPAFKGPGTSPSVQITINDAEAGDFPTYTSKTLEGFTVVFSDISGNPVARSFDALVKGYGKKGTNTL